MEKAWSGIDSSVFEYDPGCEDRHEGLSEAYCAVAAGSQDS